MGVSSRTAVHLLARLEADLDSADVPDAAVVAEEDDDEEVIMSLRVD